MKKISGHIIDLHERKIFDGVVEIEGDRIKSISESSTVEDQYILPGFIDAHVHVESSMLVPSEFARLAVTHGTVATISDPHEIGNVLGVEGVEYMIANGKKVNFKFYFGAPSCVPATTFETAGAEIDAQDIDKLLQKPEIKYLAEMMNWPGVIYGDEEVHKKIAIAKKHGKPIDGHAPGLRGDQAEQYIKAGMSTDHECFTSEEALDKLKHGMKIAIREGSAAKNFDALIDLIRDYPEMIMLCSDDKHPDNLVEGHIDQLVFRAIAKGHNLFDVLRAACINPIAHYNLEVGSLKEGDLADFILVEDLSSFKNIATYINGEVVAERGKSLIQSVQPSIINQFNIDQINSDDLKIEAKGNRINVIEALDGQLITNNLEIDAKIDKNNCVISDTANDVLKMVVINRYQKAAPAFAFIKNFNLKEGAIASSVGHDSHNIIAVGVDDESLAKAINLIIEAKGGVSAVSKKGQDILPLPVAGIMSDRDGHEVAAHYTQIDALAKKMGSTLISPYMTLSFMALLVIPELKLSDKGLFDGLKFEFKRLFLD